MLLNRRVQMLGLVTVAALASAQGEVAAATLEVTATVPNSCTVEGGSLVFDEYVAGPNAPQTFATGEFNVECTTPASVEIALDGGLHDGATGNNGRAMKGPGDNFLDYSLAGPAGFGTPWAQDTALPFELIGGSNPITVNGFIHEAQTVPGGQYSDTVQITLTFN
jgi:spore coat protein U-like protein